MKGKDLTERVYRQIKRDLMLGKFPMGELFSEQFLSEKYQCSRTPAREAAVRLVAEGFLNKYPSKGYIVHAVTRRELVEIRYSCFALENAALELTIHTAYGEEIRELYELLDTAHMDEETLAFNELIFHTELAKLSGNKVLSDLIEQLQSRLMCAQIPPLVSRYELPGEQQPERQKAEKELGYRALLDALDNRDLDAAKVALRDCFYPQIPMMEAQKNGKIK